MTDKETGSGKKANLRKQAEDIFKKKTAQSPENVEAMSPGEIRQAILELHVQETMLRIQNDELRRAQEALRLSETKFRTLYDSTSDAVMLLNDEGFFDCNKATLTIFGCKTKDEFCSKHPADLSPPQQPDGKDSMALASQMIAQAIEKGSNRFDWVHKRNDTGESFTAEVLLTAMELDGKLVVQAVVRDITERKHNEEALRQSVEKHHLLVENINETILVIQDGVIKYLNLQAVASFGYSEQELLSINIFDLIHPEDRDEIMQRYLQKIAGDKTPTMHTHRTMHKSGKFKWVEINSVLIDWEGRPATMNLISDITERKQAEHVQHQVRSWQEGVNRILSLTLEAIPFEDKLKRITDGVVETFGADFCRIWIIEKGDLCSAGCVHAEIMEGPHACRYRDKCLHLKASSGRYTHIDGKDHRRVPFGAYKIGLIAAGEEIKFLTNDVQNDSFVHKNEWAKSLGLVAFAGYRLRPPDSETLGVMALFTNFEISPDMDVILEGLSRAIALVIQKDIATRELENLRRNLEDALQREVDIYKTLAEKSFTGVFVIQDELLVYITEQAANYYGYDVATLIGTRPERIIFPEDYVTMRSMAIDMVKGNRAIPYEYRVIANDNTVRWIMETVSPISYKSRPAVLGNCIDITEKRRREVLDLHSQKLESVGQLAAGIAHEINTPIQFIGDNIGFMKDAFQDILSIITVLDVLPDIDSLESPSGREIIDRINKKGEEVDLEYLKKEIPKAIGQSLDGLQRVSKIVQAMREFSHPGGANMSDLDINKAIESTIILSRNEWKYAADLITTLAPDLPIVRGYPADFNQVILNLIVNAAQAIQEKVGKEVPEKERIEISTRRDGNEVEICIRDTGPGIPKEAQSRIFDPFFTTKEVGKGTGQGLAIAQNIIVKKHGGKIYFETKPGEGTAFFIRLPLDDVNINNVAG